MRSVYLDRQKALLIFALASMIVLSAALACAQAHPINPKQIGWPGNCTGSTSVYNIVTNSCQANGTAANPAGSPGQGQYNFSGSFAGSSHVTYDANGFPTLLGTVNTQINVMNYGAKGDCVTDDQAAITAAQTAAITYAVGAQPPAVVYFPKPTGGCYLTSTVQWLGVSLEGQPAGLGSDQSGVELRGKPGQDIFHVQDPTTTNYTFYQSWSIRNITFNVDDSVLGSFSHRFPGRWFDDAGMTNGSAVLATTRANVGCADVGQAVQVNGAGAAGANLVTTIASVSPCWVEQGTWQVVTLAAAASTTVTNAHAYISILGLSVTATIGNAAIAFDNQDGNPANWVNPSMKAGNVYDVMENVGFRSVAFTDRGRNGTIGIFTQGVWGAYGLKASHVNFGRTVWGVVQACSELNSYFQSCANDFQKWDHMLLNGIANPWVSYNGGDGELSGVELTTSSHMQFLSLGNQFADFFGHWRISIPEVEGGSTIYGMRLEGRGHFLHNVQLSNISAVAHIGASNVTCVACSWRNMNVEGSNNRFESEDDISAGTTNDFGRGNRLSSSYLSNPTKGMPLNQNYSPVPLKNTLGIAGMVSRDALDDGNSVFYNKSDLFIWPKDIAFDSSSGPYSTYYADDAASATGQSFNFPNAQTFSQYSQFLNPGNTSGFVVVGTNVPAKKATIIFQAKCGSASTFRMNVIITGGGYGFVPITAQTFSCTTSYQQYSMRTDFTSYPGGDVGFENTLATTAIVGYIYIRPDIADINGQPAVFAGAGAGIVTGPTSSTNNAVPVYSGTAGQLADSTKPLAGSGAGVTTGPTSGTIAGHMATFQGTTGQIQDGGAVPAVPLAATTAALGGSALTAGQCVTAAIGVSGATTSMVATASPSSDPGTGFTWDAWVSSANNATVRVCAAAAGTPASVTYNVRVIQ